MVFITVTEALVIMVIVASTTGPVALASLGGCFYAMIGHLVLILYKKTIESSLIMESTFTIQYFNSKELAVSVLAGVCLPIQS